MPEYKDEDEDKLCDWCGESDHTPAACLDMMDKSLDTFKRAVRNRVAQKRKK